MVLYELDKFIYFGALNAEFQPEGEGRMIAVNSINTPLKPTKIPVFFEGKFEKG